MASRRRMGTDITTATLRLNTGAEIPQVGLGVWQSPRGTPTREAVLAALRLGYRHVDTARIYGNEARRRRRASARAAFRASEIFVTTKLWNDDQGYDTRAARVRRQPRAARARLRRPLPDPLAGRGQAAGLVARARAALRREARPRHRRQQLPRAAPRRAAGARRSACRPSTRSSSTRSSSSRETRAFCQQHGIVVEAYSPLTRGARLATHPSSRSPRRVGRTPAQVLLRWGIQHGLVVLPKSTRAERIAENAALFDFALDAEAMAALDALDEGLTTGWDPEGQS